MKCKFVFFFDIYDIELGYLDNGTGAPPAWNWILSFLFTAGTMTGFDASGHIAEETKNARYDCGPPQHETGC